MTTEPLTRERIVDEAIALVDVGGPTALSMRKLAAQLGRSTMSTYHHVADKRELVDGIAERIMAELAQPDPDAPWDAALRDMAHSFRDLTRRHPHVFELLLTGPRPGALMQTAAGVVGRLESAGFSPQDAIGTFRIMVRYLLGVALIEADSPTGPARLDAMFADDLDTILAGIHARRD